MEINCTPLDRSLRNNPVFGFTIGEVEPIFLTTHARINRFRWHSLKKQQYVEFERVGMLNFYTVAGSLKNKDKSLELVGRFDRLLAVSKRNEVLQTW